MGWPAPQDFDRVLSSMCTEPHGAAREAAIEFLATNPGDPDTYPAVAEVERRAVAALEEMTNAPPTARGYIASGGTEANIQAVRIARNQAAVESPNVVAPESVHFSLDKAADLMDLDLRRVPVTDSYRADPAAMASVMDEDTICVVGVAGSTEYGRVDPIEALADVAQDYDAHCHIDAAWGGFHVPFTDHPWDFADAAIDSITIDPHKAGRAAIPAGGLIVRDEAALDAVAVDASYLETPTQATLLGTRSGAGVASAAKAMETLWPEEYRHHHEQAMAVAIWFAEEMADRGYDVVEPTLPLVAVDIPQSLFESLRANGWRISRTAAGELRVVVMPHVRKEMLERFLKDLDDLVKAK